MRLVKYWLITQTGLAVLVVRCLARLAPLPRVLKWLHREPNGRVANRLALDDIAYYVDRWLALFPANAKGNCFPRSLTLYWFARGLGVPVHFHCGIQKRGDCLDGHAWLSLDGRAILEPTRQWEGFAVTYAFPERRNGAVAGDAASHSGSYPRAAGS